MIAEELWPDSGDAAHNLRVTLNYLLQALEPDRARNERPSFVQVEGGWLGLVDDAALAVDLWELDTRDWPSGRATRPGPSRTI